MAHDKSLAAEIEAVLRKQWDKWGGTLFGRSAIPEAAAEIAALQSRAFEDGARWMRERAAETAGTVYEWIPEECALEPVEAIAEEIRNLPLQPEGERNV